MVFGGRQSVVVAIGGGRQGGCWMGARRWWTVVGDGYGRFQMTINKKLKELNENTMKFYTLF